MNNNLEVPQQPTNATVNSARDRTNREGRQRTNSEQKLEARDAWTENIHFADHQKDPETALRLATNIKLVGEYDQFVEYIHHVESKLQFPCS